MLEVIVVSHNRRAQLAHCVRSLNEIAAATSCAITIVDNASSDGSAAVAQNMLSDELGRSGRGRVLALDTNRGYSGAANHAIKQSNAEFVLLLDDDAMLDLDNFTVLWDHFAAQTQLAMLGPRLCCADRATLFSAEYSLKPLEARGEGERDIGQRSYSREVDALVGTCLLLRRTVIDRIGLFDEAFFPSQFEDIDYCMRARLAGLRLGYCGAAIVVHDRQLRDGGALQNAKNKKRFLRKWHLELLRFPFEDSSAFDIEMAEAFETAKSGEFEVLREKLLLLSRHQDGFLDPRLEEFCYSHFGDHRRLLEIRKRLLALYPSSARIRGELAESLRALGEKSAAQQFEREALEYLADGSAEASGYRPFSALFDEA